MDLKLEHVENGMFGVFGKLIEPDGNIFCFTLEHAYPDIRSVDTFYYTKIPNGSYTCIRGMHRLDGMIKDFETFEVKDVPGHSGILFHVGNYNRDSSGCILVGASIVSAGLEKMISDSRTTFAKFMTLQTGIDEFQLQIQ